MSKALFPRNSYSSGYRDEVLCRSYSSVNIARNIKCTKAS